MNIFIGIDPGINGAIAFIDVNNGWKVFDMPTQKIIKKTKIKNEVDVLALKRLFLENVDASDSAVAIIESLNAFAGGSVQSMCSIESQKAAIKTTLTLIGIDFHEVSPKEWQKSFGIKKTETSSTKKQSLEYARKIFGRNMLNLEKHDGRADALLIALYGEELLN